MIPLTKKVKGKYSKINVFHLAFLWTVSILVALKIGSTERIRQCTRE